MESRLQALFSAEGQKVLREAVKPRSEASTLPPEAYWSSRVYERELDEIFRKEWICVGRQEDVPRAGDYYTTTLAGEPILVVRDKEGEIRAFLNVCRHRGCEVVQGTGNTKRFTCPYHAWSYGLDGELKATPNFKDVENFTKSDYPLHSIRLEVWEGFVFVNLDPDAEAFAPRVSEMSRWQFEKYAIGQKEATHTFTYDLTCNWKSYVENGMEEYHTPCVHAKTLQPIMPLKGWSAMDEITDQPWSVMIGQFPGLTMSPTGKPLFPISDDFDEISPEFNGMPIVNIFPNLMLVCSPDVMIYLVVDPTGAETSRITARLCIPKESAAAYRAGDPAMVEAADSYAATIPPFMAEDNETAEAQHRGLRSKIAGAGRYCGWEKLAWRFVNWVVERAYT